MVILVSPVYWDLGEFRHGEVDELLAVLAVELVVGELVDGGAEDHEARLVAPHPEHGLVTERHGHGLELGEEEKKRDSALAQIPS